MKFFVRAMAIIAALCWGSIGTALSAEPAKGCSPTAPNSPPLDRGLCRRPA